MSVPVELSSSNRVTRSVSAERGIRLETQQTVERRRRQNGGSRLPSQAVQRVEEDDDDVDGDDEDEDAAMTQSASSSRRASQRVKRKSGAEAAPKLGKRRKEESVQVVHPAAIPEPAAAPAASLSSSSSSSSSRRAAPASSSFLSVPSSASSPLSSASSSLLLPSSVFPSSTSLPPGSQRSRSVTPAPRLPPASDHLSYIHPSLLRDGTGSHARPSRPSTGNSSITTSSSSSLSVPTQSRARAPSLPNIAVRSSKQSGAPSAPSLTGAFSTSLSSPVALAPPTTLLSSSHSLPAENDSAAQLEWQLRLLLERLAQIKAEVEANAEGAEESLALLDEVTRAAYREGSTAPVSIPHLSALHDRILSKMRELRELSRPQQPAAAPAVSAEASAASLGARAQARSANSIVVSSALLSKKLPALIRSDLVLARKLLLLSPSHVHQQDQLGNTALHYAVLSRDQQLITFLLAHHANPNIRNHAQQTPLSLARREQLDTTPFLPAGLCSHVGQPASVSVAQPFYLCAGCGLDGKRGLCDVCAFKCHRGHVLQPVPVDSEGFCDCYGRKECRAMQAEAGQQEEVEEETAAVPVVPEPGDIVFSFSSIASTHALSRGNARSLLRIMERVVIDTAQIADLRGLTSSQSEATTDSSSGGGERAVAAVTVTDRVQDVLIGAGIMTLLTPSFYALLGGAEDFVPAVQWMQEALHRLF